MQRLKGFREFYPEPLPPGEAWSCDVRQHVFDAWRRVARRYGFREYDGPPLEPLALYTAKSGDEIVGQLFNFVDKGDEAVALRPEMTPTVARMVASVERAYKKPIKWFAMPQLFRYEAPQKGRLREHFQLNCDIFGEADPAADAEIVALLVDVLRGLGLTSEDFVVRLSSRKAWQGFFEAQGGREGMAYVFFQAVDKIEREDEATMARRLEPTGVTLEAVRHFIAAGEPTAELQGVLNNLHARGLGDFVKIDYGVIRGLAYYTGVVFEAFDRKGEFRAIAGGGRYDNLVRSLSGGRADMPAIGFGMGDVVLALLLKERGRLPSFASTVDVVVLLEDESLRPESLGVVQRLRDRGLAVDYSLVPMKGDKQFRRALEVGAGHTVRLDRDAVGLVARVKNLKTRAEQVIAVDDVAGHAFD
ncbi:MAG: histidine--tRNA ligase [Verrucomicrobiota bacterium]|jgi:histidyl-tRNA synthetase